MCGPHQVWPLRSECCGRGVPTKVVCAECMKMCCLGGKNSVVKGLTPISPALHSNPGGGSNIVSTVRGAARSGHLASSCVPRERGGGPGDSTCGHTG